ncbi:MAG: biopolymer transporter ExbD [Alphaproteobacteria bacterium]|nr:biopolymer transporter ExbD [Alphaproteobacteria bacterium]
MSMAMQSGGGGGRRRGRKYRRPPMAEINVTPMVDVMLVLLIVFMVAAPLLTVGVPIDLPETQASTLNVESEPVMVSVTLDGLIYVQDDVVDAADLLSRVEAVAAAGTEERIFVRGDAAANYGSVMQVMGMLSAAGYNRIGLITEQEQTR